MNDSRRTPPRGHPSAAPVAAVSPDAAAPPPGAGGVPVELDDEYDVEPGRPSLLGGFIADRYRIERLIGIGGMGAVYYGEHVHMQKPVAVKVLHRELMALPEVVARFEREAIAAGRINDPHVVTATDFGRLPDGSFYLALEYVSGTGLADVIRGGPLGAVRALKIARQILQALAAAHAAGIVHRDLKPENVMLVARAEEPDFVKVLDFGIAKIGTSAEGTELRQTPGGALTRIGSVFGTPQYMAPEQAAGQEVDARADLYTVGIILYEMLAGRPPFSANDVSRVLAMHLTQPPPPLPESVEPGAGVVAMHLLAKSPADRPQTAEEAIARVDQGLRSLGVSHPSFAAILHDDYGSFSEVVPQQGQPPASGAEPGAPSGAPAPSAPTGGALVNTPPLAAAGGAPLPHRGVPLWVLVAAVSLTVGLGAVAVVAALQRGGTPPSTAAEAAASTTTSTATGTELDPELAPLLARATLGNRDAVAALERRRDADRSVPEWVALARGRMAIGEVTPAFEAYLAALERDPAVAQDPSFLEHLRRIAQFEETSEAAMRLAAARLGAEGADMLYDIWVSTRAKNTRTQLAKSLVYGDTVRPQASPALSVLLDLRAVLEAQEGKSVVDPAGCAEIARLLPAVTLHADQRAVRVLQPLLRRNGCGPRQASDCYPCLRRDGALNDAMAAARLRAAPQ